MEYLEETYGIMSAQHLALLQETALIWDPKKSAKMNFLENPGNDRNNSRTNLGTYRNNPGNSQETSVKKTGTNPGYVLGKYGKSRTTWKHPGNVRETC